MILPHKIKRNWDFGKYLVSKKASKIIKVIWDKPLITIKKNDVLLKKSNELSNCSFLKSKLIKIYDLMKCESMNKIIEEKLEKFSYLVLKENLFSLKDLYEISECDRNTYSYFARIQSFIDVLENHILKECEV